MNKINLSLLSKAISGYIFCNGRYKHPHKELIELMEKELPSGSGIDSGCEILLEKSNPNKIVIKTSFHHINENGYYDGWSNHNIIIKPGFGMFYLQITGKNRNDIKTYLFDLFHNIFFIGHDGDLPIKNFEI